MRRVAASCLPKVRLPPPLSVQTTSEKRQVADPMVGCSSSGMPKWLEAMLGEKFFNPCAMHETSKKNEKNNFCLDCCSSFCPLCLPPHRPHRLLQIRRYVYHCVVRVEDLEKLIDCSHVQSYTTNSAKVIFLNERPQGRAFRGASGYACRCCDRHLQEPFLFCSLCCKVKELQRSEPALWRELRECEHLPLPGSCDLDEGQLTPDSILESGTAASSDSNSGSGDAAVGSTNNVGDGGAGAVRKRGAFASGRPRIEVVNRRKKGVPNRSPLF